jgi:hypothetical protein
VDNFSALQEEEWECKLLIGTPDFITMQEPHEAVAVLLKRGKRSRGQE